MPLTVSQALEKLPILSSARVVAGLDGLNRPIYWTHIVDNPDVIPWVRKGVLLLTTAFALKDNLESQSGLIASLEEKELAGMVVSIGRYIREVPQEMVQAADELAFPIITLPWEVPLVEVTHAIHEYIVSEQYALNEQSAQIHKILTQLVIEGGGMDALTKNLASILDRSIMVTDPSLYTISFAPSAGIFQQVDKIFSSMDLAADLKKSGFFEKFAGDPSPKRCEVCFEDGVLGECLVTPVLVGRELYGYVWIASDRCCLSELDSLASERAASVAALIFSQEQAVYEAETRVKTSLLESLINPQIPNTVFSISDTLRRLGLHGGYHLLLLEEISPAVHPLRRLYQVIDHHLHNQTVHAAVVEWGQRILVLLGTTNTETAGEAARSLITVCSQVGIQVRGGLSAPTSQASDARRCYQEAGDALRVGPLLSGKESDVWYYTQLGYWTYLINLPPEIRTHNHYYKLVCEIETYDRERGTSLLSTLEAYLDNQQNMVRTARKLFIHRNTLIQRLEKIQDHWPVDLKDGNTALNLLVAIKDRRLNPVL